MQGLDKILEDNNSILPSLHDAKVVDLIGSPLHEVVGRKRNSVMSPQPTRTDPMVTRENVLSLTNLRKLDMQALLSLRNTYNKTN